MTLLEGIKYSADEKQPHKHESTLRSGNFFVMSLKMAQIKTFAIKIIHECGAQRGHWDGFNGGMWRTVLVEYSRLFSRTKNHSKSVFLSETKFLKKFELLTQALMNIW